MNQIKDNRYMYWDLYWTVYTSVDRSGYRALYEVSQR